MMTFLFIKIQVGVGGSSSYLFAIDELDGKRYEETGEGEIWL